MTYFHYYATTSRNLDRVFQYGVFPISQAIGSIVANKYFGLTGNQRFEASANIARWISAGAYSLLTTTFFGLESEYIDNNARKAVAAEMGIDPEKIQFSDYKQSSNAIVSKAYKDILRLQKYRYGTDALFLLPIAMKSVSEQAGVPWDRSKKIRDNPDDFSYAQHIFNGHNAWDYGIYAAKAAYWGGETFFIPKSGHYEIVKLIENLESTGKDLSANDLLGVYQRARMDRGLTFIPTDDQEAHTAIRSLLQKMADAYNKHDGKFTIPEIVYLLGLNKVNIHKADGKTMSQEAIEESSKNIDKVISVGLDGIREENKKIRDTHSTIAQRDSHRSFSDKIADGAFKITQTLLGAIRGKNKGFHPEEYITVRDPGETTGFGYSINR